MRDITNFAKRLENKFLFNFIFFNFGRRKSMFILKLLQTFEN